MQTTIDSTRTIPLSRRARRLAAAAAVLALGAAATGAAPPPDAAHPGPLVARLRAGGLVMACRPAATDGAALSRAGREQAAELGRILRRLRIPVGDVHAGPAAGARETAELAFGRAQAAGTLQPGAALRGPAEANARRALFFGAVPRGTNRVLVADATVVLETVPGLDARRVRTGQATCVVVEPGAERPAVGRMDLHEWRMMLR